MKETIPKLSRVAVFWDSTTPPPSYQLNAIKAGAEAIAVELQVFAIRGHTTHVKAPATEDHGSGEQLPLV